jgi:hypothetical protein
MKRFTKNSIEFMADPDPYDDNFGFGILLIWDICNNDKLLYNLKEIKYYYIFRLGHVAGGSAQPSTILSFLYKAIKDGTSFNLWKHASRNIIDIDDVSKT